MKQQRSSILSYAAILFSLTTATTSFAQDFETQDSVPEYNSVQNIPGSLSTAIGFESTARSDSYALSLMTEREAKVETAPGAICPVGEQQQGDIIFLSLSNPSANKMTVQVDLYEETKILGRILENGTPVPEATVWKLVSSKIILLPAAQDGKPTNYDLDLSNLQTPGKTYLAVVIPLEGSERPDTSITKSKIDAKGDIQVGKPINCSTPAEIAGAFLSIANTLLPSIAAQPILK